MNSSTLTERYVQEVARRIPADQRDDVAAELRTTIADTVQAHESDDLAATEREVLIEMGDPIKLAANYSDRPLALIGPTFYPAYVRMLRMLLTIVLPIVVVVTVVLDILENNDLGSAIGVAVVSIITIGAQMIAWPTAIFALLERVIPMGEKPAEGCNPAAGQEWTPDALPELREDDNGRVDACGGVIWNGLVLALLLWQQLASPYRPEGDRIAILDPALWSGWIWPVVLGIVGLIAVYLVRLGARQWTGPLVGALTAAHLLLALPLAWILQQRMFFNPEFLTTINEGWTVPDVFYTGAVIGVLVVSAWDVVEHIRKLRP